MKRLSALVLSGLAVTACGGLTARDAQREAVERYVRETQSALQRNEAGFRKANEAYVAYARGELDPDETLARMRAAQQTIEDARDGVAVLDRTQPAAALHDRLMAYLDLNRELAVETTLLGAYTPRATRALAPIESINRRLTTRLAAARESRAQVRALDRFGDALGEVTRELRSLEAPPVLEATHRDQIRRLERTRRLAHELRVALLRRDAKRVATLLERFRAASRSRRDLPALEQRSRAAYAHRIARLSDAYGAVRRETVRLRRDLG